MIEYTLMNKVILMLGIIFLANTTKANKRS